MYLGCNILVEGKTSKSKNFKKGNIGMANMHKKQRRQDRDGLVMMARCCSNIAPLSSYTNEPYGRNGLMHMYTMNPILLTLSALLAESHSHISAHPT